VRSTLLTGGSSGIGAATARLLASDDARLWLTYANDESGAMRTAEACVAAGAEVELTQLDQRSPAAVDGLLGAIRERWGSLHVLINNGAICPYTPWDEIDLAEWDAVMETNVRGAFLLSAGAVPLMRVAEGDRAIVNVVSIAGQIGGITTGVHYASSKGALLAMTRSFARLLASDGIRVNAVSPGPITTRITAGLAPMKRIAMRDGVPLGRFGDPEEVAHAIVLLASSAASFTTGATYDVNGGLLMH
jgi:NAD(P)-dependent dehydrogenase (short-subunit alcohol dehydrogenase family)